MTADPPTMGREQIGLRTTQAPHFRSSDRGKWTQIPKARRTIAELTEIIKRVIQNTYFPFIRAYNLFAKTTTSEEIITEFVLVSSDGTIWLENEYGIDTYIHGDSTWSDPEGVPGNQIGAAYVGGWDMGTSKVRNGAVWCDEGPMIFSNSLRLPLNDSNVAKIVAFDTDLSGNEQYILKATLMGDHDFKLEYDHGGELVEIGQSGTGGAGYGAKVYRRENTPIPKNIHTKIPFDQEIYDTDNIHDNSTNNTRLTCVTPGKYIVTAHIVFAAVTLWDKQGHRQMSILKTDPDHVYPIATTRIPTEVLTPTTLNLTDIVSLNAGDFLEVEVQHTSNYSLNVLGYDALNDQSSSIFTMQRTSE